MEIQIDGRVFTCTPGEYLIDIAARNGIEIPTLCHHEGLRGQGRCRVCIVEMDGRIVPACMTKVERPCTVNTSSAKVERERGVILALLRKQAPNSPEIAALAKKYHAPAYARLEVADQGRCILCGLCVEACNALGTGAIAAMMRGTQKKISTPYDEPSDACVGCGSCAQVCPTGNIPVIDCGGVRKIWNREFQLEYCEVCGAPLGTTEFLKRVRQDVGEQEGRLCEECRKRETAETIQEYCRHGFAKESERGCNL